ncbi:MAG: LysR family transcriptional regulator [Piscinibacter sp.]|nr:LysR family transcriptional regulator [Piscinibacter sp.]
MAGRSTIDLNALRSVAAVAEAGGFTAAAERLGVSKARVSLDVARLEAQLGAGLFVRTTRRTTLTEAGAALLQDGLEPLRRVEAALASFGRPRGAALSGSLRVATTADHAAHGLARALAAFGTRHPALQIELRSSDRVVDLVAEGVDVAIRLGWLRDSSLRATRLADFEQQLVASPAYLKRAGTPRHPEELAQHDWVALSLLRRPLTWTFVSARGERCEVRMTSRLRTDAAAPLRALVEAGAGVSVMDQFNAEAGVRARTLVRLLPDWALPAGGVHAVWPPGRHVPAKVRAFVDFYADWLAGAPPPR